MTDRVFGTRSFGVGNGNVTAAPHIAFTALFAACADGDTVIACRAQWRRGTTQYAET
ncbi:hypothetical protein [Saccharopolyspora gloriosae]|uniref:hypothetical protein n=1 Tax=Saccharopolyspora gloriosae TaxID=455344 RepID=UPI001FB6ACFF|nr:hypothetical protein [Saccharopolyspora gloriosae]